MEIVCPKCPLVHDGVKINGAWVIFCPNSPPGMMYSVPDLQAPVITFTSDSSHLGPAHLFDGHPDDAPGYEEGAYWPDPLFPTPAPVAPLLKPAKKHWYEEDGGVA